MWQSKGDKAIGNAYYWAMAHRYDHSVHNALSRLKRSCPICSTRTTLQSLAARWYWKMNVVTIQRDACNRIALQPALKSYRENVASRLLGACLQRPSRPRITTRMTATATKRTVTAEMGLVRPRVGQIQIAQPQHSYVMPRRRPLKRVPYRVASVTDWPVSVVLTL